MRVKIPEWPVHDKCDHRLGLKSYGIGNMLLKIRCPAGKLIEMHFCIYVLTTALVRKIFTFAHFSDFISMMHIV